MVILTEPEEREEQEHGTCVQGARDLINKLLIPSNACGNSASREVTGTGGVPESLRLDISNCGDRIP